MKRAKTNIELIQQIRREWTINPKTRVQENEKLNKKKRRQEDKKLSREGCDSSCERTSFFYAYCKCG